MTLQQHILDKTYLSRALEVSIHVGLFILLATACLLILRPFLPLTAWGIVIAIAVYPAYVRLNTFLGGRNGLAAVVCTLLLLAVLIVPVVLLTGSMVEGVQGLAARLNEGAPIPPPPPRIETLPVIGPRLKDIWELASRNLTAALQLFAPQIKAVIPRLLSASAGLGLAVLQMDFLDPHCWCSSR